MIEPHSQHSHSASLDRRAPRETGMVPALSVHESLSEEGATYWQYTVISTRTRGLFTQTTACYPPAPAIPKPLQYRTLDIQVAYIQGMFLDKLTARLDPLTH